MELILNITSHGYKPFLMTNVDSFIIGLKQYCVGEEYALSLSGIIDAIKEIKEYKKKIYLNLNFLLEEDKVDSFKNDLKEIVKLDVDGYIISDLGVFNIFKKIGLLHKVVFNPHTYLCNNLSVKFFLSEGVHHVALSSELTSKEIIKIGEYNDGNIEILLSGFPKISASKRKILSMYFDYHHLEKKDNVYYLKEKLRDTYLPIFEDEQGMYVFNHENKTLKEDFASLRKYVKYFRIDSFLKSIEEVNEEIDYYKGSDVNE